jgi:glucose/arabinose dehydrogenase
MSIQRQFGRTALVLCAALATAALIPRWAATRADEPEAAASLDIRLQLLQSGLGSITSITNVGDSRVFLTTQDGRILIDDGTTILTTPFLDLSTVVSCCGERGLLSVAFHPSYSSNGFFFVYYTAPPTTSGDTIVIARYHNPAPAGNAADPNSGLVLLTIDHPTNLNHNGGQLQFGPADGYLYFGTGDGGSGNDPLCNAQNDNAALGKLLRIDVNVATPPYYKIPAWNPHYIDGNVTDPLQLTWAKGLRNPYRFSFDRMAPHDLWIGDVGQDAWEEIDRQPASSKGGENYGWKMWEGNHCSAGGTSNCDASPTPPPCPTPPPNYKGPVHEYHHDIINGTERCAIIGGYVYRGAQVSGLAGTYVYGDLCTGEIWGLGSSTPFTPKSPGLQTFGQDSTGELYLGTGGGQLFKIVAPAGSTPTPTRTPTPTATPDLHARPAPRPPQEGRPPARALTPRPSD